MLKFFLGLLFLKCVEYTISTECFPPSESIQCICDQKSVMCNGVQREVSDIQQLLLNISLLSSSDSITSLVIDIQNLTLDSQNVSFKDIIVGNLTLRFGLTSLQDGLFHHMLSLTTLNLQNNAFYEIPLDALNETESLKFLSLSNNNVTKLRNNNFLGLSNLEILQISNNSMNEIENNAFSSLLNLKELLLDNNKLFLLRPATFIGLINLELLSLAENLLDSLDPLMLQNLPVLKTLILDDNDFSSFSDLNMISPSLEKLSARKCSIQDSLDNDLFPAAPELKYLDLSFNSITEVKPFALSFLKNLHFLNLSYNIIKSLHNNAFSELQSLVHLDLKSNMISVVGTSAFLSLTKLKILDISSNQLVALLCDYTSDLLSLESINMQNNSIRVISAGSFKYSHNLKEVKLEGSSLDCTCSLSDFANLLLNSSMKLADIDSIRCVSPPAVDGVPIVEVDFQSLNCQSPSPCESAALLETEDYDNEDVTTSNESNSIVTVTEISTTTSPFTTMATENIADNSTESYFTTIKSDIHENDVTNTTVEDSTTVSITDISTTASSFTTMTTENTTDNSTEFYFTTIKSDIHEYDVTNTTVEGSTTHVTDIPILTSTSEISSTLNATMDSTQTQSTMVFSVSDTTSEDYDYYGDDLKNSTFMNKYYSGSPEPPTQSTTPFSSGSQSSLKSVTELYPTTNPFLVTTSVLVKEPKIEVKNFSLSHGHFCIEWSINTDLKGKPVRCFFSYVYEHGRASTYLKCPELQDVVKKECLNIRSKNEIYELCVKVDDHSTRSHVASNCITVQTTTTTVAETDTTLISINTMVPSGGKDNTSAGDTGESTTFFSSITERPENTTLSFSDTDSTDSFTFSASKADLNPTLVLSTETNTLMGVSNVFNVTKFIVYPHNISSAIIEWEVNIQEPVFACHLALTWTTGIYNHTESTFTCKNYTYVLSNMTETEIYDICLSIYHLTYGFSSLCRPFSHSTYEFSVARNAGNGLQTFPLVILICLLIAVCILIAIVVMKSFYHKRTGADVYDVTEQEKRFSERKASYGLEQSVRYSHILNDNVEL